MDYAVYDDEGHDKFTEEYRELKRGWETGEVLSEKPEVGGAVEDAIESGKF